MALPETVMLLAKQLESCHCPLVTSTEATVKFSMIVSKPGFQGGGELGGPPKIGCFFLPPPNQPF